MANLPLLVHGNGVSLHFALNVRQSVKQSILLRHLSLCSPLPFSFGYLAVDFVPLQTCFLTPTTSG